MMSMDQRLEQAIERVESEPLRHSLRAVMEFYTATGPAPGEVDIVCWGPDHSCRDAGAAVAAALLARRDSGMPLFRRIAVISQRRDVGERIRQLAADVIMALAPARADLLDKTLEIIHTETLDADALVGAIAASPEESACVVLDAGSYRDLSSDNASADGEWAHHLVRVARRVHDLSKTRHLYVLLMAGRFRPHAQEDADTLEGAPGAVSCALASDGPEKTVAKWLTDAKHGELARVLTEIEGSSFDTSTRLVAGALCRRISGDRRAYEHIRPELDTVLPSLGPENVELLTRLASSDPAFMADLIERSTRSARSELVQMRPIVDLSLSLLETELPRVDRLNEHAPQFTSLVRATELVIQYLALHPRDAQRRVRLSNVFATESAGTTGLVLLAWLAMNRPAGVAIGPQPEAVTSASSEEFVAFHEQYWEARRGCKAFTLFPEPLTISPKVSPNALISAGMRHVEHMASEFTSDEDDIRAVLMVVKTCLDLSTVGGHRYRPAQILRVAAGGFVSSGNAQAARDLAEHALMACGPGTTPSERWLAWVMFSDVYHRAHNAIEALVAWLCARAQPDVVVVPAEAFPAMTLLARIFRDFGAHQQAFAQTERCRQFLAASGHEATNAHLVEDLESSILMGLLLAEGGTDEQWTLIAQRLAPSVRRALDKVDMVSVPALMLAQVLRILRVRGTAEPPGCIALLDEVATTIGEPLAGRLRAFAADAPDLAQLSAMAWAVPTSRYARDMGEDLVTLSLFAKRTVVQAAESGDAETALIAAEMLADHSVRPRAPAGASSDPSREHHTAGVHLREPGQVVAFAQELSLRRIDIHALALGERGSLVQVPIIAGKAGPPVVESKDTFDSEKAFRWNDKERRTLIDDPDDRVGINVMEQRMRGIGFSSAAGRAHPRILVRSHELADLPANILLSGGELIGSATPVTAVPSLTWLASDIQHGPRISLQRTAWLLPELNAQASALTVLRDALETTLPMHGVSIHRGVTAPAALAGSGLAIIAGHGRVWGRERYFQVLAGEDDTMFTPTEVAQALKGCAIALLLVCSGGRLDRDVMAVRSVGLPHLLLAAGCRSVVASPWPIDAAMAGRWVGPFLEALDLGFTVSEATHHANLELRDKTLRVTDFLAMHVSGNPFVTISVSGQS